MEKKNYIKKTVIFANDFSVIDDLHALEKVGAGHDGIIYRYGDDAIKELKYDIETRKKLGLMTFEKLQFFINWSKEFKRLVFPVDILLDEDGVYCAYVMDFIEQVDLEKYPLVKTSIETFLTSIHELYEDFEILNKMSTVAKDINMGSYLYSRDFIHICDLDKYVVFPKSQNVTLKNREVYNYIIAKFLYFLMYDKELGKENLRKLNIWVKECSQTGNFLNKITNNLLSNSYDNLGEYTTNLKRTLLK